MVFLSANYACAFGTAVLVENGFSNPFSLFHHPTVPLDEQISQSFFCFVETLRKKTLLSLIFFLGSLKNRFLLVICQGHSFANVNYRRYSDVILHFTGTHTKLTISGGHLIAFAFSPSASIAATISYYQTIMIRGFPSLPIIWTRQALLDA